MYVYGDILNTVWSAEKVFKLLDRKPNMKTGHLVPEKLNGRITFDNVTFSYPSRQEEQALKVFFNFRILKDYKNNSEFLYYHANTSTDLYKKTQLNIV